VTACDHPAVAKRLTAHREVIEAQLAPRGAAARVARALKVSEATVSRMKAGRDITFEEVSGMAEVFGLPVEDLLLFDGKPFADAFISLERAPQYVADLASGRFAGPEEPTVEVKRRGPPPDGGGAPPPRQSGASDRPSKKASRRR
jgi:plasmid maintenance system antidote protein VapI